jgi:tetratricopeptide (TPR) repeat protein
VSAVAARALERLRAPLLATGLAALCLLVFAPALSAGFLLWDDADNLLANTRWRGLGFEELRWMFSTLHLGPYQPLSWMSYAVDWQLWGLDPRGYHLTNVLLHACSAVLCFLCARELFAQRWPERRAGAALDLGAAAAAALFALHPLRVESVAWVTERRDVLSGFFLLLSLRAWLSGAKPLALAAYAASLLSKGTALGWPLVLLALDAWLLGRANWKEKLPYFALSCVLGAVAWLGQSQIPGAMAGWSEHGLAARLAQASYGWLFYPLQTIAVAGVRPVYDLVLPLDLGEPRFLAALVLAPALFLAAWALRKRWPAVWVALLAYTLLAAPVLGLAQSGPQLVAARYSYLACIPFALLAGAWVARRPRALALAALLVALLPGWRAHADTRAWRGDRELWTRARELDPGSRGALRNLVAAVYAEARASSEPAARRARLEEALALCAEWERLGRDAELENARGSVLAALADQDPARAAALREQALAALRAALELARASGSDPTTPESNLIALLAQQGRASETLPLCLDWTARRPQDGAAWAALGHARTEIGEAQPALAALGRALALDRDLSGAWLDRGLVLAALGRREEARAAFEQVLAARRRLGDSGLGHPDAVEARLQLERLGPAR